MHEFEIPIVKKIYEFYKDFHLLKTKIPKTDRHTIFQKCDNLIIDLLDNTLEASQLYKSQKLDALERASRKISFLRILFRLMKDVGSIDLKAYSIFEEKIDEIGRMLGGWIRSSRN
jgi:hypothetical protein